MQRRMRWEDDHECRLSKEAVVTYFKVRSTVLKLGHYNSEDQHRHLHHRENLKSHILN
jgi:pyridoxine/pyridoxamine 5'-phosphate oxidase